MTTDSSLPHGFVFPGDYRPKAKRVLDQSVLDGFKPFERPYVVLGPDGSPAIDSNAPVAVSRLRHGRCPNLTSMIRYFELGGSPDDSMQATYNCEDTLVTACDYSEAGFHQTAIEIIRSLPKPFQGNGSALKALVESLMALGRNEEALTEVRLLIANRAAPTDWALTLHRLEEVQLLLILGRLEEAEEMMNQRRAEFQVMYQYYGYRAALALLRGDEPLARFLVTKAGRVDPYHSYKILWNPLLKSIEDFIRKQLLTDQGDSLLYQQDGDIHRLCNRIQGALLLGDANRAANLAEGLILHQITSWTTAEEMILVLAGLGRFESLFDAIGILPGKSHQSNSLARQVVRAITTRDASEILAVGELADQSGSTAEIKALLIEATQVLAQGRLFALPANFESLLVEVADKWREDDRDLFNLHYIGGRFVLTTMSEPRQRRSEELRNVDLRKIFAVTETTEFKEANHAAHWIEEKLAANTSYIPNNAYRAPFMINFDGWNLVATLQPAKTTPLLQEALQTASHDPNFYFKNGPASSFGLHSTFAIRLLTMLTKATPVN